MLIDTHSHLNFRAFDRDRDEVAQKCLDNDVWVINAGSNYETSKKAVELAEKYEKGVYAAVGLHPINLDTGLVKVKTDEAEGRHLEKEFDYEKYKALAVSKKVIAVGETGLDYWHKPKTAKNFAELKEKQKEVFLKHLELASELDLPVILHCRSAHNDLIEVLTLHVSRFTFHGVVHCFTGDWPQAEKYLEAGLYLGFNGIIFKLNLDEVIEKTPFDRILVETDCPYLTPPQAAVERNDPLNVKYVVQKIAEIKKTTFAQVAKAVNQNAQTLFRLQ